MFRNRAEAAERLARRLAAYRDRPGDAVVLAIPRGGVPVGAVVARRLRLGLDVLPVKKLTHPADREYAVGAVTPEDAEVDAAAAARAGMTARDLERETERARRLLAAGSALRGRTRGRDVRGKTAIVVDDGAATGWTILAGIRTLRRRGAARVVAAVPVAPAAAARALAEAADEAVCLETPADFRSVGAFYEDFSEVTDEEAASWLREAEAPRGAASP